jgi:hypothetical protein
LRGYEKLGFYDKTRETAYNEHIGSMAALPPLENVCEMQVCRPQERAWKPPLPQYAKR